jgi:signal-transduction protein with cAMP-binding, CBS, and nucleotidyltransferase domain
METGILVREAMTNRPTTAGPKASIKDCAQLMKQHDVGSIVIVDKEKLLGIVTEFDMVRSVVAEGVDVLGPVTDIMVTNLFTVDSHDDIFVATDIMNKKDVRHLPVVDNGKFVGFITMKDILRIQPDMYDIFYESRVLNIIKGRMNDKDGFEGYCSSCGNYSVSLSEYGDGVLCPECLSSRDL